MLGQRARRRRHLRVGGSHLRQPHEERDPHVTSAEECTAASLTGYDTCLADYDACISTPELGAVCEFPLLAATQTLFSTCVGEWTTCDTTHECKLEATVDALKDCDAVTEKCMMGMMTGDEADTAACSEAVLTELTSPDCLYRIEDCGAWIAAADFDADYTDCEGFGMYPSETPNFMSFFSKCELDKNRTPAPTAAPKVAMTVGQSTPIAANVQLVYCAAMEAVWVEAGGKLSDSNCEYNDPTATRRLLQDVYSMELKVAARAMSRNVAKFADTAAISAKVVAAVKTAAAAAGIVVDTAALLVVTPVQETPEPTAEPTPMPTPAPPTTAPEPTVAPVEPTVFYSGSNAVVPSVFGVLSLAFLLL